MSSNQKILLQTLLTANGGCGACGCTRPKPSDVYEPAPVLKPKTSVSQKRPISCSPSCSNCDKSSTTAAGLSFENEDDEVCTSTTATHNGSESETNRHSKASKIINSIVEVKDSNDPYEDFKDSMLQMILGRQIYSKDDLQELLNCLLQLNSPCHHDLIVQAFTEIWNEVISNRIDSSQKPCDGRGGGGGGGGVSNES